MPCATIAASASDAVASTVRGARVRTSSHTVMRVMTTSRSTSVPCTRARSTIGQVRRRASRSPPCGPAAVTNVPTMTTTIVHTYTTPTARNAIGATIGRRGPSGSRAVAHLHRDAHEREREEEVAHHAEPRQLHHHRDAAEDRFAPEQSEQDPGESHEIAAPGRSWYAPINASAIGMPIAPEKRRFSCSIAA